MNMFRSLRHLLLAAIGSGPLLAGTVFSSGPPNQFAGYSITSTRIADDFTLTGAATIEGISFFAFLGAPSDFQGTLSYAIYANGPGNTLGAVQTSGTVNSIPASPVSVVPCNVNPCYAIQFNLTSSVALAAGTYWLELHEGPTLNTNDGTDVFWLRASSSINLKTLTGPIGALPSTITAADQSFSIQDAASVPEPASIGLVGCGLGAFALWSRRRQCAHARRYDCA